MLEEKMWQLCVVSVVVIDMPNFAKFLDENPEFAAVTKTEDGSIYSLDRVSVVPNPQCGIYVSKADQEKYGFSVEDIKTVDDFYEVLKLISKQTVCRVVLSQVYDQLSMVNNAYREISQLLEYPLLPEKFIECWDQQVVSDQLTTDQLEQLAKFIESLEKRELHETEQILQCMTGTDDRESGQ